MDVSDLYTACRTGLLDLARVISPQQASALLATTPPWNVTDGYRHLSGVCANFLDGVLEGAGSPAWTAAQIDERQAHSLKTVCAEWATRGPVLDAHMAQAGPTMGFLAFDAWTHEQDIRAAIGSRGVRNDDRVSPLAALALDTFGARYESSGSPSLLMLVDGEPHLLGALGSDPAVTLGTSPYELLRIIFGRRSEAQIRRANWTGDVSAVIDALHIFDLPTIDVID